MCFIFLKKTNLAQLLYLADNLAYFPFQSQDEPLFIIHHINTIISVSGTNLLQNFREVSILKFFIILCMYLHLYLRGNIRLCNRQIPYENSICR